MNNLIKSEVVFIENPHSYVSKEGVPVMGLTSLLGKHKITKDISNISKVILNNAAERGTLIHQQCEDYDLLKKTPTHKWAIPYTTLNLKVLESEFLVSYKNIVATQIDKILEDFSVCDIKTSREVDIQGVTWQCSIGAYILEKQSTVRQTAKVFGVSKSTVHKDVTERLEEIQPTLASEVKQILEKNKSERHIRGGMATKLKYQQQKKM